MLATTLALALAACYEVPVTADLKPYATFNADGASVATDANGTITIAYNLPSDIVGATPVHITLTGTAPAATGQFFKVYEQSTATLGQCVKTTSTVTCMLHYANLDLDATANAAYLTQKYPGDTTLPQRIAVMNDFAGESIGILSISL